MRKTLIALVAALLYLVTVHAQRTQIDPTALIKPSTTDGQVMFTSGTATAWATNLLWSNSLNSLGVRGAPNGAFAIYAYGPTRTDATIMSVGTGAYTSTNAPALRIWNTTATTGDMYTIASENAGDMVIASSNQAAVLARLTPTAVLKIGSTNAVEISNSQLLPSTATSIYKIGNSASRIEIPSFGVLSVVNEGAYTTQQPGLILSTSTTTTPEAGMGASLTFRAETLASANQFQGSVNTEWTDIADASRTSDMVFYTVNSATTGEVLRLKGNKQTQLAGSLKLGQITGTPNTIAGLDGTFQLGQINIGSGLSLSSGVLSATGGGGSGVTTVGATILANNANAASITGTTINMHRADDINPGVVRLAGDLDGTYLVPQVDGLKGRTLDNTTPSRGMEYRYVSTSYTHAYPNDLELAISAANDFTAPTLNDPFFTAQNSGTGAATSTAVAAQANQIGIANMTTGTTATGTTRFVTNNSIALGGGNFEFKALNVQFPVLTNGTETFQFCAGLQDGTTAAGIVDGVFFRYSTTNANWQCVTRSNSVETAFTTATAVNIGAYYDLEIVVNAAGTSADFIIDNTVVHTATTNIPTGFARQTGVGIGLFKTVGTTARTATVDAVQFAYSLAR